MYTSHTVLHKRLNNYKFLSSNTTQRITRPFVVVVFFSSFTMCVHSRAPRRLPIVLKSYPGAHSAQWGRNVAPTWKGCHLVTTQYLNKRMPLLTRHTVL